MSRLHARSGCDGAVGMLAAGSIAADLLAAGHQMAFGSRLLAAVLGLVCVEQVYHNAPAARRWAIKFLCLALVGLFGFDVALYSDALLFGKIDFDWWSARGYANAMLVPLVAVAAARNPHWKLDIAVSRRAVFHSTALLASGAYLIAVAAAGYWLRLTGGQWGGVAQTLLLFGAVVGLSALAASGTLRARMRVTLAKNFFSYRYDYREEWQKLTALIALPGAGETDGRSSETLGVRAIRGLASLVESPGGVLWLRSERGDYVPESRWAVHERHRPCPAMNRLSGTCRNASGSSTCRSCARRRPATRAWKRQRGWPPILMRGWSSR